ncbi:DUF4158 domain-containing protein [Nonomuraea sp. NPDC050680]|uniref:DUF4158 domain-containing protein n=1 Tax=Nonomuraea sp. NPDC050680 TaxID=3154630 RepID=UPI0033CE693C
MRPPTKLGWAVRWGTVRMLVTFLANTALKVPAEVVEFAAEQVEVDPFVGRTVRGDRGGPGGRPPGSCDCGCGCGCGSPPMVRHER